MARWSQFKHLVVGVLFAVVATAGSRFALALDVTLTAPQPCGENGILIDFEQFEGGTEITNQFADDGVFFSLSNGEGPRVARTTEPRQFPPAGDLEINNFPSDGGAPVNIVLDFSTPMNLIAFELRSQTDDDVHVTLRSTTGTWADVEYLFDTGVAFVFAGILTDQAFDQVIIEVTSVGGGVIVDNIRFGACEVASVPADLDRDGSVTLLDFATFIDCITGPDGGILAGCSQADYDTDGDVDMNDNVMFTQWFGQ